MISLGPSRELMLSPFLFLVYILSLSYFLPVDVKMICLADELACLQNSKYFRIQGFSYIHIALKTFWQRRNSLLLLLLDKVLFKTPPFLVKIDPHQLYNLINCYSILL